MKVILIKNHPKLGKKFDIKEVNPGYAKNFLLPKGIVMIANEQNIKSVNRVKAENKARDEQHNNIINDLTDRIKGVKVEITKKANKEGKLFASITKKEVKDAIMASKLGLTEVPKIQIDKHIKKIGLHEVVLDFGNKKIPLKLNIKEG